MAKPGLSHRAEYGMFRAIEAVLRWAPGAGVESAGALLGTFVRSPLGIRRAVVEENLRRAFPDADDEWLDRVSRDTYRHLGREAAAMLRMSRLTPAEVRDTVAIPDETWRQVEVALEEKRGVILATGHYGNWEMAAAAVAARGVRMAAIVKRQSNPLVNARIEAARRSLGIATVDMGEAPRRVPRLVLDGWSIGIVADQDARRGGVWVPFFGYPASTHRGTALFALRLGTPLFAAVARRLGRGRYLLDGVRLDTRRTDSLEDDVRRVTSDLARHLEGEIRRDPAQYFWFHKRWKTPPPEEPFHREAGTKVRTVEDSRSS